MGRRGKAIPGRASSRNRERHGDVKVLGMSAEE